MNFVSSCSLETGRLLQILTSQMQSGVIGEVGAVCGVASAWIVSALTAGTTFFTVEQDEVGAAVSRALFDSMLNVRVVQGDWHDFLSERRFSMLYAGASPARESAPHLLLGALRKGGLIVLDGLTPLDRIPFGNRTEPDPLREFWLNDSRLLATEILVSQSESVILATFVD
jgi:predicted O-methyltransferase YrrM